MKAEWVTKKLSELSELITDGTHNSPEYVKSGIPMLDSKHVKDGFVIDDTEPEKFISLATDALLSKRCKPRAGDILISSRGSIGKIAIVREKQDFNIMGNMILIRLPNTINRDFAAFYLHSKVSHIESIARGVAQKGLYLNQVRDYELPLPPLPEQQRIVTILDEAFAGIATANANAEKNLANARELFESTVKTVFANGGDDWEAKTINQIAENLDSKRVPITKNVRSSGAYPYYGASGIVDYVGEFIFDDDLLLVSEDGANLLARTYPIAFSISGKTWVNNHAHVLRFKEMATQKLVEYYLNSIPLNDYVSGMAQPKLNQKMLNTIVVPYPSLAEQQLIVAKLDELSAETKKLETIYQQKRVALDELKKSILNQAFSGQLN